MTLAGLVHIQADISLLVWTSPCTAAWSSLPLQALSLSYTGVNGFLPPSWADASANSTLRTTLQQLFLHKTQINGPIPDTWVSGFSKITQFTIWGTGVCGPHPVAASGLGTLCLDTTQTKLGALSVAASCLVLLLVGGSQQVLGYRRCCLVMS